MKRHIGFIQSFAKGGNISSIEKRVAEVNAMIKEANEKDIDVVDTSVTWQSPMKYEPLLYKNGILYIKYKELDLYHHNRGEGSNWAQKSEKIGKHNTDYGFGEKEGYAQKKALTDIARMYRTALNHYKKYGYYADGGELSEEEKQEIVNDMHKEILNEYLKDPDGSGFGVFGYTDRIHKIMIGEDDEFTPEQLNDYMRDPDGTGFGLFGYTNDIKAIYNDERFAEGGQLGKNGFTIREMNELLNTEFPDSFGFKVFPIKKGTNQQPDYDAEIVKGRSLYGLEDSDIKVKLYFPQYKRDHEINYDIHQGGENTYFDFLLEDAEGNYYAGTFGFKDEGDVPSNYITKFLVFLQKNYGLPFEIVHEVMAKGGKVKDEPVIRQYFEDEPFEYAHGGNVHNDSPAFFKAMKFANPLPENTTSFAEGGKLKPRYLTTDETIAVGKKYAEALSKFDGKKYTLNLRTLEIDSFDIDSEEHEFDGGSYNVFENGDVKNMALSGSPVYGKIDSSVDEIIANLKKLGYRDYMALGGQSSLSDEEIFDRRVAIILKHYVAAALWSSNDEDEEPLDANYWFGDVEFNTLRQMFKDIKKFVTENAESIKASGMSDEQLGHDLWLTRNGHGAGFWDRGYDEEIENRLTDAAKELGGTDLYVGDDRKIHAMCSYSSGGWMETTDANARIKKDYEDEIASLKRQINYCNVRMGETSEAWIQKEYRATINGCRERIDEIEKTLHNIAHMAAGGTFEEGVKAIEKKLTGSKVAAKYQSLYGKKYDKKEAHVSATKIKGSMRALELAKKHKKKK